MARMLLWILAELLLGNIDVVKPTYVRNDYSDSAYPVDSANTATREKRTTGLLASNREELEKNQRLSDGYIPGDINASDGIRKKIT